MLGNVFPDEVLRTSRLSLRPFQERDIEAVLAAGADPVSQQWLPLPRPYTREHARTWCCVEASAIRTSGQGLVRALDADGRLVGAIDLKRTDWAARTTEIGYWTAPGARGQGYMTEAVRALALWTLQDMGFERVEIRVALQNTASQRVAEKSGFVPEGVARSAGHVHAGRVDLQVSSLIRADLGLSVESAQSRRPGSSR